MTMHTAAVLIPLIKKDTKWHILYEVRAFTIDVQPGEICFPGGGVEAGETPLAAVLRETNEELLIPETSVEILHEEEAFLGPGGTKVVPFAGILHDYRGTFGTDEVDHVFTLPVSWFLEHPPVCHPVELTPLMPADFPFERIPGGRSYPWRNVINEIWFYPEIQGEPTLWGMTARVTKEFVETYAADFA